MKMPTTVEVRDVALTVIATILLIEEVRPPRPLRSIAPSHPALDSIAPSHRAWDVGRPMPDAAYGWLYEVSSYGTSARPLRPALPREKSISEATRAVDGTGVFALMPDNTIVARDDPAYPPSDAGSYLARYCWVAP